MCGAGGEVDKMIEDVRRFRVECDRAGCSEKLKDNFMRWAEFTSQREAVTEAGRAGWLIRERGEHTPLLYCEDCARELEVPMG